MMENMPKTEEEKTAQVQNSLVAYQALCNEYDFYRRATEDPITGLPAGTKLKQIYDSKAFGFTNAILRFVDKMRGIAPATAKNMPAKASAQNFPSSCGLPKIALLVDAHGWAFDNATEQIVSRLSHRFEFTVFYLCDIECSHVAKVMFALKGFDLVHVFWRGYIGNMTSGWCQDYIESLGGNFDDFLQEYYSPLLISSCVADPLLFDDEFTKEAQLALNRVCCYYTTSKKLFDLYMQDPRFPDPFTVIHDFVRFDIFCPKEPARFAQVKSRPLRVGWAGNSQWNSHGAGVDLKGVQTIITPAVESLKRQGFEVELYLADRKDGIIPHLEMPEYYNSIDVYVCASTQEGTPNPILEAMACGLPVISTDVGIVPEVFGEKQREFIMPQRTPEVLEELLKKLIFEPEIMAELSSENLSSIKPWSWDIGVKRYEDYFNYALGQKEGG